MTVPNVPPDVRRPPIEPVSNQETVSPPGPRTVLVVDDYPAVLAWASRAFERAGWRILTATDGPEAEALFDDAANRGEPVDLLVTDLQLSAVSGAALVRRMRALNPVLPVIAIFVGATYGDDWHGSMLDHTSFFQKPVRAATLLAAADALLVVAPFDDEICPDEST